MPIVPPRPQRLILLVLAAAAAWWAPPAASARWARPVSGPVMRPFALAADRFAAGQHRGVDLGAAPGTTLRSACSGRVSFAGTVPSGGRTISVRCGGLIATYQHLATVAVSRGRPVAVGTRLGATGRSGLPRGGLAHVHFGVRDAASGSYLDPLSLISDVPPLPAVPASRPAGRTPPRVDAPRSPVRPQPVPVGVRVPGRVPAHVRRSTRAPARTRAPAPTRSPAPIYAPAPTRSPAPTGAPAPAGAPVPGWVSRPAPSATPTPGPLTSIAPHEGLAGSTRSPPPWPVWAGLACVGLGLPMGGLVRLRRRRSISGRAVATS